MPNASDGRGSDPSTALRRSPSPKVAFGAVRGGFVQTHRFQRSPIAWHPVPRRSGDTVAINDRRYGRVCSLFHSPWCRLPASSVELADQPVGQAAGQQLQQHADGLVAEADGIQGLGVLLHGHLGHIGAGGFRLHAVLLVVLHLGHAPGDPSAVGLVAGDGFLPGGGEARGDVAGLDRGDG